MAQAHEFLRNFCLSNPQNQALLHKHLDLFLTPGVSSAFKTRVTQEMIEYSKNLLFRLEYCRSFLTKQRY